MTESEMFKFEILIEFEHPKGKQISVFINIEVQYQRISQYRRNIVTRSAFENQT